MARRRRCFYFEKHAKAVCRRCTKRSGLAAAQMVLVTPCTHAAEHALAMAGDLGCAQAVHVALVPAVTQTAFSRSWAVTAAHVLAVIDRRWLCAGSA